MVIVDFFKSININYILLFIYKFMDSDVILLSSGK